MRGITESFGFEVASDETENGADPKWAREMAKLAESDVSETNWGDDEFVSGNMSVRFAATKAFIVSLSPAWFSANVGEVWLGKIIELCQCSSKEFAVTAAETACKDFVLPPNVLGKDLGDLTKYGSVEALVRARQAEEEENRFNTRKCDKWLSNDPEYEKLRSIAESGAIIDVMPDFVRTSTPEAFRQGHSRLSNVFVWHGYSLWKKRQAILIPMSATVGLNLHFNQVHWAPKPGKPEGRFISDLSNAKSGSVLNDVRTKELLALRYGTSNLPTIRDIVASVFKVAAKFGGLQNVRIWKDDITSAFNQWNFSPASATLLAFRLSPEVCMIQFTGNFGWQGSPSVWGVFNRAIRRETQKIIKGEVNMYVDDTMAASPLSSGSNDQQLSTALVKGIFNDEGINSEKSTLPCRCMDCIGWTVDLVNECIYPNEKGIHKIIAVFFSVDTTRALSLTTYQRMGSIAARYSQAIVGTRPFVHTFFKALQHKKSSHPSAQTKFAILIWRAIGLVLLINPLSLAASIHSFIAEVLGPEFVITTDAGPKGIGVVVKNTSGKVVAFCSYRLPFNAEASDYQNVREFLGLLLGTFIASQISSKQYLRIVWINDNRSALAWARKNIARSSAAQAAFIAWSWCVIKARVTLVEAKHIPGIQMGDVDSLSRFYKTVDLDESKNVTHTLPVGSLDNLFILMDPTKADRLRSWINTVPKIIGLVQECLAKWQELSGDI